jgi:hypothetical protein
VTGPRRGSKTDGEEGRKRRAVCERLEILPRRETDTVKHSPCESVRCHSSSLKYSDIVSQGASLMLLFHHTPDVFDKPDNKVIHVVGIVHALQRANHVLRSQMQCSVRVCSRSLVIHAWPHDTEVYHSSGKSKAAWAAKPCNNRL